VIFHRIAILVATGTMLVPLLVLAQYRGRLGADGRPLDGGPSPSASASARPDAGVKRPAAPTPCPASSRRVLVGGSLEVAADTEWPEQCVEVRGDTSVRVTNGAHFTVRARRIVLFDGARLSIDGTGVLGTAGPRGDSVGGEWASQGDSDYWAAVNQCRNDTNHPDRGKKGGKGGNGGRGAEVVLAVRPIGTGAFTCQARGGSGGPGGPGGGGRLLKNGRNNHCDGCTTNCPNGPPGDPGDPGADGACKCGNASCF
jgi:hypothetical protein